MFSYFGELCLEFSFVYEYSLEHKLDALENIELCLILVAPIFHRQPHSFCNFREEGRTITVVHFQLGYHLFEFIKSGIVAREVLSAIRAIEGLQQIKVEVYFRIIK